MWGIIPAAGRGTRIQPLAFSKELLPIGSAQDGDVERPKAVSEYLAERMLRAGASKLCMVVSPDKCDIISYYGRSPFAADLCFAVQPEPLGLCDAVFRALPFIAPHEQVLVGLPNTIWFPENGFELLPKSRLSFLLFRVERPELFDAVLLDRGGRVTEIRVKSSTPGTPWIWGAFRLTGDLLAELHDLWVARNRADQYVGTLVNAYLEAGGGAYGITRGEEYVDVGTVNGYRRAVALLGQRTATEPLIHRDRAPTP